MKFPSLLIVVGCVAVLAGCASGTSSKATPYVPAPTMSGPVTASNPYEASARSSMAAGDVAGAEASFGQAVDTNPFDPIALNNLAVAKTEAGQFHEALGLLERAERLAPQNTEVAANLARLRAWNQNYAMQDGSTLGDVPAPGSGPGGVPTIGNLPPEPPPLWDTRVGPQH